MCFFIILWNIWYAAVLNVLVPIMGEKLWLNWDTYSLAFDVYWNKECISYPISAFLFGWNLEITWKLKEIFFKDILHLVFLISLFLNSPKKAWSKLYKSDFICVSQSLQGWGPTSLALGFEDLYLSIIYCWCAERYFYHMPPLC